MFDNIFVGFPSFSANQKARNRTCDMHNPPTVYHGLWLADNAKTNLKMTGINQKLSRRGARNGKHHSYANVALREIYAEQI